MHSVQKCADRFREQTYEALTPQIQALENELRDVDKLLFDKIRSIGNKLEALRRTEIPAVEPILNDYLQDEMRKRNIEWEMLALFTRGLRTKETQDEILVSLLDNAANYFPRVALFVVRGDRFKGWASRGFSDSVAETISSDEFRKTDFPVLAEVLNNGDQAESACLPDTGSLRLMREEYPGAWRLYPLYVLGSPAAVLFAGDDDVSIGRAKALVVLMDCAALRLENVALKIIKTLNESASDRAETAAPATEPLFADPGEPQPVETASGVLNPNPAFPIETPAPVDSVSEPEPEQSETNTAPQPPGTDEEKLHAAARRFAELLVSGIKLYNEDAVAEGRKNRDLYNRLRSDMDRNREMYEKRVPPTVARSIDYLHNEFIRILGDGDDGVFGDGYPGPLIAGQV